MIKIKNFIVLALLAVTSLSTYAQTADEVVDKYFTAVGGKDKLAAIKSVKLLGKGNQQGMEFPIVSLQKAPNKMKQVITFQSKEIVASCFDGKESWATNFMTMKAEKSEAEDSENASKNMDFPDPFLDYKAKGYSISLEGEETVEGSACHKIKLTKKPMKVDGKEEENSSYYFFDKENGVIIMQRETGKKGPGKGMVSETFLSDYTEVNGIYFPYTVVQKMGGKEMFSIKVEKMEMDVAIEDKEFAFPQN